MAQKVHLRRRIVQGSQGETIHIIPLKVDKLTFPKSTFSAISAAKSVLYIVLNKQAQPLQIDWVSYHVVPLGLLSPSSKATGEVPLLRTFSDLSKGISI